MILSLDPSSSCIGYAVGDGSGQIREAGRMRPPSRARDALAKVRAMRPELVEIVDQYHDTLETALIETPAPQQGKHMNARGQANYGMAVGYVIRLIDELFGWRHVHTVRADQWTRQVKKQHRQRCLELDVPGYRATDDPGGDVADAIGLLRWWAVERMKEKVKA
jgi:hypothetical protein